MIRVVSGFTEDQRQQVAQLFWAAFSQKLDVVLGPQAKGLRFIADAINPDYALCALDDAGSVLGVAGFKTWRGGFVGGSLRQMIAIYGLSGGLWRAVLLDVLGRDLAAGQLLMDGIFVHPEKRGQGVGGTLLDALEAKARGERFSQMQLEVADSNPRARALYERRGFEAVQTKRLGLLRHVFGFRSATVMVLQVSTTAHS